MKVYERTENGTVTHMSVKEALFEVNHAMIAGKKDVREMSSSRDDHRIEYRDGRIVRMTLVDAPEPEVTGPKGSTTPKNRSDAMNFRILSAERQQSVMTKARELHEEGGLTPARAWKEALRLDWVENLPPVPDESEFGTCIAMNGGEIHSFSTSQMEDGYHLFPLCRTMDQNSRGTHYVETKAQDITCRNCIQYREGRAKRRASQK